MGMNVCVSENSAREMVKIAHPWISNPSKISHYAVQSNLNYPNLDHPNPRLSELQAKQKVQVKVQNGEQYRYAHVQ